MKRRFIHWPAFLLFSAMVLTGAWLIVGGFGAGFWIAAGVIALAILINGAVATIEDELPGGYHNPKPPGDTKQSQ
jgi:hypothetical protein